MKTIQQQLDFLAQLSRTADSVRKTKGSWEIRLSGTTASGAFISPVLRCGNKVFAAAKIEQFKQNEEYADFTFAAIYLGKDAEVFGW
jgi:hypothetical protein